jgi:Icc protein
VLIAQITDTHVRAPGELAFGGQVDTNARLAGAVRLLCRLDPRPDVVLATGDLADTGHPDEYAQLQALLAQLDMPVLPIPGNHDARGPLRDAFPGLWDRAPGEYVQYVVEDYPLRLVALDTLVTGQSGGRLCPARLAWIDAALAQSTRPTVLFMHHPPYEYGAAPNPDMSCEGADALARLVAAHDNVAAVLCGHLHRFTLTPWAGTVAFTAPATAPQLELNLHGRHPKGWLDGSPMVGLHLWRGAAGLVSHVMAADEPAIPRSFTRPK